MKINFVLADLVVNLVTFACVEMESLNLTNNAITLSTEPSTLAALTANTLSMHAMILTLVPRMIAVTEMEPVLGSTNASHQMTAVPSHVPLLWVFATFSTAPMEQLAVTRTFAKGNAYQVFVWMTRPSLEGVKESNTLMTLLTVLDGSAFLKMEAVFKYLLTKPLALMGMLVRSVIHALKVFAWETHLNAPIPTRLARSMSAWRVSVN